tara:strand:- start:40 stop:1092 length:1053 start_codon:yes stop_codon:yes gene_type:complete
VVSLLRALALSYAMKNIKRQSDRSQWALEFTDIEGMFLTPNMANISPSLFSGENNEAVQKLLGVLNGIFSSEPKDIQFNLFQMQCERQSYSDMITSRIIYGLNVGEAQIEIDIEFTHNNENYCDRMLISFAAYIDGIRNCETIEADNPDDTEILLPFLFKKLAYSYCANVIDGGRDPYSNNNENIDEHTLTTSPLALASSSIDYFRAILESFEKVTDVFTSDEIEQIKAGIKENSAVRYNTIEWRHFIIRNTNHDLEHVKQVCDLFGLEPSFQNYFQQKMDTTYVEELDVDFFPNVPLEILAEIDINALCNKKACSTFINAERLKQKGLSVLSEDQNSSTSVPYMPSHSL